MKKKYLLLAIITAISVLVLLIPTIVAFCKIQIEKTREADDAANLRYAYNEILVDALLLKENGRSGAEGEYIWVREVPLLQQYAGWQNEEIIKNGICGEIITDEIAKPGGTVSITYMQTTGKAYFEIK